LWEIVFANKVALALTALVATGADGRSAGLIDGLLAVLIAVAYVLARGWAAWSRTEPPVAPRVARQAVSTVDRAADDSPVAGAQQQADPR